MSIASARLGSRTTAGTLQDTDSSPEDSLIATLVSMKGRCAIGDVVLNIDAKRVRP